MHTCFVKNIPSQGAEFALEKREHDHLFKTLRCRASEQVRLCDGNGTVAMAEATSERTLKVLVRETVQKDTLEVHLFTALPKNSKLDLLLKPVTEAGVVSITPLKCRYSVSEKESIPERWYTLMEEACKQSGNPFMPEIRPALTLPEAVEQCCADNVRIFYGDQHGKLLTAQNWQNTSTKMAWFVGPEGGFDETESELLNRHGCGLTLGKYIFRLENAALAGISYLYTTARAAKQAIEQQD